MGIARRVAKNTGVLFLGNVLCRVFSVLIFAYLARVIGDVGLGKYAFAVSFVTIFFMTTDMGIGTLAVREVAEDESRAGKYLGNIGLMRVGLSIIGFIIICLAIGILNCPAETKLIIYILGGSYFFLALSDGFKWCFQAFQKFEYSALLNIIQNISLLIFGFPILLLDYGLVGFVIIHFFVSILYLFFTLLFVIKRFARPKFEIDIPFWKELGRKSIPFMTLIVIAILFVNLDNIMLSRIAGDAVTGWYSASAKLAHFLKTLPVYFATALFPVLVNLHKSESKGFIYIFNKSSQYMLMIGIPLAVGTTILTDKIILLIYGGKFVNSIPVLKILIWTIPLVFIQSICIQALVSINRERNITYITGTGLVVTVVLYFILIPKLKHIGVSLSVFSGDLLITLWGFIYLSKVKEGITLFSTQTFKIIFASIIMGMFLYLGRNFNLFLCIGAGVAIYILLLLLFKGVSKEDWEMIKRIRTAS